MTEQLYVIELSLRGKWKAIASFRGMSFTEEEADLVIDQLNIQKEYYNNAPDVFLEHETVPLPAVNIPYDGYRKTAVTEHPAETHDSGSVLEWRKGRID